MIQGRFKGIKKKFKGFFKGVSWQFQLRFKEVSRVFKESVKCVPRKFQIKFQEFSRMFLQFCCCMDLIAATRAEGGLVFFFEPIPKGGGGKNFQCFPKF